MTVKIAYILSSGHSGSTILGNVLGELAGWFNAGELRLIWRMGLVQGRLCGCGRPVRDCEIWSKVVDSVFADGHLDLDDVMSWHVEVMQAANTRRLLSFSSLPSGWNALDRYVNVMSGLYSGVADVTGARVIVDSSKREDNAALLRLLPNVQPYVIHLIRDPRGVVYSWHRREGSKHPGSRAGRGHLPGASARGWTSRNRRAALVRRSIDESRWLLVRYEDFVSHPRTTIEQVADFLDEAPAVMPFVDDRTVLLDGNHTAGGNENRFKTGPVALERDVKWLTQMPHSSQLIATCLTLPLLHRYGYPIRPHRVSRSTREDASSH